MAAATSRFLAVELKSENENKLRNTFSSALILHITIAVSVTLICETFGIWFLEHKLVIPVERMSAARMVLQFSIISMFFNVVQVPFNSAIIAHEKMDVFAYVEILNSILRLVIVYLLWIGDFDKLILYSILTGAVSLIVASVYSVYGIKNFKECSFRLSWHKEVIKPMLSYSGFEFYGNMSLVAITQGVNILLNMWFGTMMNAAYDIATRVKNIIMSLSTNVTTAIRPQIYKTYSSNEIDRMLNLMQNGSRITFIFMMIFCSPLIVETHYILHLWLGVVPEHAETLLRLSLLWNLGVSMSITMGDVVHASGDIKFQSIVPGTMYLLIFPITYIAFKLGAPYWVPFLLNVVTVASSPFYSGYTIKKHIKAFSWRNHVFPDLFRYYLVMILVLVPTYSVTFLMNESFARLVVVLLISTVLIVLLGYFIVLPKNIRSKVVSTIKKIIKRTNGEIK